MTLVLEQKEKDVHIYVDEPFSIRLYEYIYNELEQPAIHHESVIVTVHSSTGTEVHTTTIEVLNSTIETILSRIVERFPGKVQEVEGKYYIELNH